MVKPIIIAIDVMGGDNDGSFILPGLALSYVRNPDVRFILYGDEKKIQKKLLEFKELSKVSSIVNSTISIGMAEKPGLALKRGRNHSSMWQSINSVKIGEADFVVSAGNTGALMAMSKIILRTMANIQRPAIAAIWPTIKGESIVLDVGATIGADANQLVDFSVLGASMAQSIFNISRPSVSLLNIGVEEVKGLEQIRDASNILSNNDLFFNYQGFVEGNDIGKGEVDVVVMEGFNGNIALKTAEGTAKQISEYFKSAINRSLLSKIGYFIASSAFRALKDKMNPSKVNGGVFLGLNGIVIKSHGSTDALGFASAVDLGIDMSRSNILDKIRNNINDFRLYNKVGK